MVVYTQSIFIPHYGIELALTRKRGSRWWVVGTADLDGTARERDRKPRPRGAVPVAAFVTSRKPHAWRPKRKRKRAR